MSEINAIGVVGTQHPMKKRHVGCCLLTTPKIEV